MTTKAVCDAMAEFRRWLPNGCKLIERSEREWRVYRHGNRIAQLYPTTCRFQIHSVAAQDWLPVQQCHDVVAMLWAVRDALGADWAQRSAVVREQHVAVKATVDEWFND